MRKSGSTLIESIAATAIILMMFIVVVTLISGNIRISAKRKEVEESNRIIYCIMQEIKYNIGFQELLVEGHYTEFEFEMYDGILKDLIECNVLELTYGDDIKIIANGNDEVITVEISVLDARGDMIASRIFNKYRWMEYYD